MSVRSQAGVQAKADKLERDAAGEKLIFLRDGGKG